MHKVSVSNITMSINNSADGCPKCGASITFMGGLKTAREAGIQYNVLMCSKCRSVYEVDVALGGFIFSKDVTDDFAHKCAACDGHGKHKCSRCNGRGYFEICQGCKGKKTIPCDCQQGRVNCTSCKGSGKQPALFGIFKTNCKTCAGIGTVGHEKCKGSGIIICNYCLGRGMLDPCSECSTKGERKCEYCSGFGWKSS